MLKEREESLRETFLLKSTELAEALLKSSPLSQLRQVAWRRFQELGLPDRKQEAYRRVALKELYLNVSEHTVCEPSLTPTKESIAPLVLPECTRSHLVLVNGQFAPQLSDLEGFSNALVVQSLSSALATYSTILDPQWRASLAGERDPFSALNAALHREGLFLYLPPNTVLKNPLQVIHLITSQESSPLLTPRLHLLIGRQSRLQVAFTRHNLSGEAITESLVTEISLEDGSQLDWIQTGGAVTEELPRDQRFEAVRASLKRGSRLKWSDWTVGAALLRRDLKVALKGENSDAELSGLWMLEEDQRVQSYVHIDHMAPNCRSMQLFKGVLFDSSESHFEGKIYVYPEAQQTQAYQLNRNLLLSDAARATAQPNLEIFADDVKASHGATIGQLDRESLFYLCSRGIPSRKARDLLIRSFCEEVTCKWRLSSLLEEFERYLHSERG
ncbi:MAG: Fe-S cluster assembly protein SufD [Chlamydiia bacterium]|nr:Fe-S cluster assembly protein SufD [Chlamydiia bacterium]